MISLRPSTHEFLEKQIVAKPLSLRLTGVSRRFLAILGHLRWQKSATGDHIICILNLFLHHILVIKCKKKHSPLTNTLT